MLLSHVFWAKGKKNKHGTGEFGSRIVLGYRPKKNPQLTENSKIEKMSETSKMDVAFSFNQTVPWSAQSASTISRKEEQCWSCLFALPLHIYLKECRQQQFCKAPVQNPQLSRERRWGPQLPLSSLGVRGPLIRSLLLHQNFSRNGH